MRGKGTIVSFVAANPRITPAYAGKSFSFDQNHSAYEDHPRVCGEKEAKQWPKEQVWGSPPRMRGKAQEWMAEGKAERITPAYAGKSLTSLILIRAIWDHPRVCGEKTHKDMTTEDNMGSPPRMRGKANNFRCRIYSDRITPAYAGKRLKRSRSTVPPVAIVPLFPSVCNKPVVSDGSPAGRDAPLFLPAENAVPASPAYNLRSL